MLCFSPHLSGMLCPGVIYSSGELMSAVVGRETGSLQCGLVNYEVDWG